MKRLWYGLNVFTSWAFDLFMAGVLGAVTLVHTTGDWTDVLFAGTLVLIYLALCWPDRPKWEDYK